MAPTPQAWSGRFPVIPVGRELAFTVGELRFFQVLTEGRWWRRAGPGGVKSDAQVLEQSVQLVLLNEGFDLLDRLLEVDSSAINDKAPMLPTICAWAN